MDTGTKRKKLAESADLAANDPKTNRDKIVAMKMAKRHGERKLAWLGLFLVFLSTVFSDGGVLDLTMKSPS